MSDRLARLLEARPWLLADGATGTNYFAMGLETGDAPELWNVEHQDRVADLHRRFVEAGADIVLTNSFGGTRYRLKLHGAENRVGELNRAAAEIAREVGDQSGRDIVVGGSMGPTGEILEPIGALSQEDATAAFAEQAVALAEGGADVLWIETMSSVEELTAAVAGAGSAALPIVCTLSFDTNGRTMMGVTPAEVARMVHGLTPRPVGYGGNCGTGPSELLAALLNMAGATEPGDILVAKGNCGIPRYVEGEIRYSGTPELMADYARLAIDLGARVIGGCCGTTPEHLAAMRAALENHSPGEPPTMEQIVTSLGEVTAGTAGLRDMKPEDGRPDGGRSGRRRGGRRRRDDGGDTPRF